jgi:WD40 repeat protein
MLKVNTNDVNTFKSTNSKIFSISSDGSITIFDKRLNLIQKIKNAHDGTIFDISLKDKNNFATCSGDKSIKTWKKSENKEFLLDKTILNIHENDIHKIKFLEDDTIISGSKDNKIKILKLVNNEYKCNIFLDHHSSVYSLLYLKEENMLISTGIESTCFWNLNDLINAFIININAFCYGKNALQKLDKERVVVGGEDKIQILSIKEKKIIKEIDNGFLVWAICVIEEKKIFICGGVSNDISIINSENYEKINTIKNGHAKNIRGISLLNNGTIITGSEDNKTKIWKLITNLKK